MFFRNTGTDVFMSGISKQEGGIPMKISKKMLAAAVLAFAFGVAGGGGGGGAALSHGASLCGRGNYAGEKARPRGQPQAG